MGTLCGEYLRTLQRQHKITIRRLNSIQKELNALPEEEVQVEVKETRTSVVRWFLRLVGR